MFPREVAGIMLISIAKGTSLPTAQSNSPGDDVNDKKYIPVFEFLKLWHMLKSPEKAINEKGSSAKWHHVKATNCFW